MLVALLVGFLACGLGGILRFAFSLRWNQNKTFPTGTFIANVFGSALLAFALTMAYGISPNVIMPEDLSPYIAFLIGFCGGLTTYSTLAKEASESSRSLRYLLTTTFCCLLSAGLSYGFTRVLFL